MLLQLVGTTAMQARAFLHRTFSRWAVACGF
jgi:hypothetical protein